MADPSIPPSKIDKRFRHGLSRLPEYKIWKGMKSRCFNPRRKCFDNYGGRGITVCDSWRSSFAAFVRDMGPRPSSTHSIERVNNNGNYEPNNCVWLDRRLQANNTRRTMMVTANGETLTQTAWSRRGDGRSAATIRRRVRGGLRGDDVLNLGAYAPAYRIPRNEAIVARRVSMGITQRALAKMVGIGNSHMCSIERGNAGNKWGLSSDLVSRLSAALGVVPNHIFE